MPEVEIHVPDRFRCSRSQISGLHFLVVCAEFGQQRPEGTVVHRLGEMSIETGFLGPAAILVLAPPREGYQERAAAAAVLFADSAKGDF